MSAFRDQLRDQLEEAIGRVKRQLQHGGLSIAGIDVGAEIAHGIESTQKRIVSLGLQAAQKLSSSTFPLGDVVRPWVEQCAHVLGALDPSHVPYAPSYDARGQDEPRASASASNLREIDHMPPDNDVAVHAEPVLQEAVARETSDREISVREESPTAANADASPARASASRSSRAKPAASAPRVRVQVQPRPSARSGRKPRMPSDPRSN